MICPTCGRAFTDPELRFCVEDGTPLVVVPVGPTVEEQGPRIRETAIRPTKEVGAVIEGRYVIRGSVGEGGMARVYLAEDVATHERVALKILRREQVGNRIS